MTDPSSTLKTETTFDPGHVIPHLIATFEASLRYVDEALTNYIEESPAVADAGEILLKLNKIKRDLSTVYDSYSKKISDLMGNASIIDLPSGGSLEKKGATERKKWQNPELASRVAERLSEMSVDMDTGEIIMDAKGMVVKLLDYAAVSYWRVGKLGEIGINPDAYCEQGDYKTNLIVRGKSNE